MMVAKSVSIELNDLIKISEKIKNGEAANVTDQYEMPLKKS